MRDLLGLDVDVSSLLPPDNAAFGFDNIADALGSSPALLQAYLSAARRISAVAVGDPRVSPGSQTYSSRQDLSQGHQLDGMPLGTVGGIRATHTFPVDGEYEFQVRMWRTNLSAIRGLENPHDIELALDGARLLVGTIGGPGDLVPLQKNPTLTSDTIEAQRLRVRATVKAGQRELVAAVLDETPAVLQTARLQPFIRDFDNPFGAERAPHVQSITVTGPFEATGASQPPSPTLFVCRPAPRRSSLESATSEVGCARRIATTLARRAYRRPLTPAETDALMDTYRRERASGTFDTGVGAVVRRVLASPSFVFRPEDEPAGARPRRRLRARRLRAGVAPVVLPVELDSRRGPAARGRGRTARQPGGVARAGAADAGRPEGRGPDAELRRPVAVPAEPARHPAEHRPLPRLRRQPAPGDAHRGRAVLLERGAARTAASWTC